MLATPVIQIRSLFMARHYAFISARYETAHLSKSLGDVERAPWRLKHPEESPGRIDQ
jgi:hypothetical protein